MTEAKVFLWNNLLEQVVFKTGVPDEVICGRRRLSVLTPALLPGIFPIGEKTVGVGGLLRKSRIIKTAVSELRRHK